MTIARLFWIVFLCAAAAAVCRWAQIEWPGMWHDDFLLFWAGNAVVDATALTVYHFINHPVRK